MTAAVRVGTFEHDSPEWHAARAQGIGASEVAAVLGLSPWESYFSLWHRKAGLIGPQPVNDEMRWGHYLEPAIAARFADEHPELRVQRTGTWRAKAMPFQIANPDRLAYARVGVSSSRFAYGGRRVPVEIKWSPNGDGWGKAGTDEIPIYYRCQIMWQLDVLGAPYGYVAALVGSEYREYVVDYDLTDALLMRNAAEEFMNSLERGEAPDIDATGHTYQVLRELHPDIEDRDAQISDDVALMWPMEKANAERAAAAEQLWKNKLLAEMGTARYATYDGQRIARRQPSGHGSIALHAVKPPKTPKTIKEAITT